MLNKLAKKIIHHPHIKKVIKHPHAKKTFLASITALGTDFLFKAKIIVLAALIMEALTFSSLSSATTATGVLTANATVSSSCTLSANTMAFGSYTGTQTDQIGTITANCTPGTAYTIAMTTAQTGGNYVMNTSPVITPLNYKLYTNTARTTEIVAATVIVPSGLGNGNNQNTIVYGRLLASQSVNVGAYSGTTTFTLTY
jgi:spore coat protein U-like protein